MKIGSLNFVVLAALVIAMASCESIEDKRDLKGEWIEMESPYVQGFELKGGLFSKPKAKAIGTQTLEYDSWELKGRELILRGKSIGNQNSCDFEQSFQVLKLDDDELVLRKGDLMLRYAKVEKVKGTVTFADGVRTFQEKGDDDTYWLIDRSGELQAEFVNSGASLWKKNCTLKVIELEDGPGEYAKHYDGTLVVIDIL